MSERSLEADSFQSQDHSLRSSGEDDNIVSLLFSMLEFWLWKSNHQFQGSLGLSSLDAHGFSLHSPDYTHAMYEFGVLIDEHFNDVGKQDASIKL